MNALTKLFLMLKGKRTYILVLLGLLAVVAKHFGYIPDGTEQTILEVLGFGTAAALRSSVSSLIQGPPGVEQ